MVVTSSAMFEFQPEFVPSGFQGPGLTYIFIQLLTNLILLNLIFVF